jgi:hypothetical protein
MLAKSIVSPRTLRAAALPALTALLVGCGGGGGSDGDAGDDPTGIPEAPSAELQATTAVAEDLARVADQRTRDLRLAGGLTGSVQTGTGRQGPGFALGRARALAVRDYSGEMCGSGSATLDVPDAVLQRFQDDPNAQMQAGDSIRITTSQCVIKAPLSLGDVSAGSFGVGSTIDGNFALTLDQRSGADYLFSLTYENFSFAPPGGMAFDPLTARLRVGVAAGERIYTLDLADARVLQAPVLSNVGNQVLVQSGRLMAPVSGGHARFDFESWDFDVGTLRARSGRVLVAGAGGTQATIDAAEGAYSVRITAGGASQSFTVAR